MGLWKDRKAPKGKTASEAVMLSGKGNRERKARISFAFFLFANKKMNGGKENENY